MTTILFTEVYLGESITPFDTYIVQKSNEKTYRVHLCNYADGSPGLAKLITVIGAEKWDLKVSIVDEGPPDSTISLFDKYWEPVLFLTPTQDRHEYKKW